MGRQHACLLSTTLLAMACYGTVCYGAACYCTACCGTACYGTACSYTACCDTAHLRNTASYGTACHGTIACPCTLPQVAQPGMEGMDMSAPITPFGASLIGAWAADRPGASAGIEPYETSWLPHCFDPIESQSCGSRIPIWLLWPGSFVLASCVSPPA